MRLAPCCTQAEQRHFGRQDVDLLIAAGVRRGGGGRGCGRSEGLCLMIDAIDPHLCIRGEHGRQGQVVMYGVAGRHGGTTADVIFRVDLSLGAEVVKRDVWTHLLQKALKIGDTGFEGLHVVPRPMQPRGRIFYQAFCARSCR